ncbi:FadD4: long-chain-fatty-acid--CoA ligase [Desulfosarcina variabilis str. Montpellier]|uniref:class I adenylate-forming enzyme family protein n=1 Tax=Desulfosarcina variabilis TaxID=2300 RepID=UPI003AFB6E52
MNLGNIIDQSAHFFPEHPAICIDDQTISYGKLKERTNRVATALIASGISPGDRVALNVPNSLEWIAFYYGAIKCGAVAVTLPGLMTDAELGYLINDAQPRCILTTDDKVSQLERLRGPGILETLISPSGDMPFERLCENGQPEFNPIDRDRSDTAAILFTGGTTGIPKGVMLSHENIYTAINNVVFNERSSENDRALCFLPFNHVFGQIHIMNATLLSGGCIELIPGFDLEKVLTLTAADRITKLYAVPTVYVRLLAIKDLRQRLGAVRYCFSAAASMAVELVQKWKQQTGLNIHEAYGMTESASMVTYNHYYRHQVGSVGTPVGCTEVQIRNAEGAPVDQGHEGEICIRGRNIMQGYLNRPEETQASFWGEWFRSGDVGFINDSGYLFIVDRIKDLIITGGENVYPREIEEVLYTFPEISECAVIGLPDKEWGERVTAMIVPAMGHTVDIDALKTVLKKQLSAYKIPKQYNIVEELPKSPSGKILKRNIRKTVQEAEK